MTPTELALVAAAITAVGTAILTVYSVWRLLMSPLSKAVTDVRDAVARLEVRIETGDARLEARIESGEARRESDIKDIWKYLATRKEKDHE